MFILYWLGHQMALTYRQIQVDVTIPHIFTGVILYGIVHTATKTGHRSALRAESLFKNVVQRRIHAHVHLRHGGQPWDCKDCQEIIAVEQSL